MNTSDKGISLIKQFEGFCATAYPDGNSYSVGYGHNGVTADTVVTLGEAEDMLRADLPRYEKPVNALGADLTQEQFDACVCLCYNIGAGAFARSTVARLIKADPTPRVELQKAWLMWNKSGGKVLPALSARRREEYACYAAGADDGEKKNYAASSCFYC